MPNFLEFIKREGRFFVLSRSFFALVLGFLSWPILLSLLDLYDSISPIMESDALTWVLFAAVLSFLVFIFLFIRSLLLKPTIKKLAEQIEANPDLLDMLNCAVELEESSKSRPLTYMEKRVLHKTELKARNIMESGDTSKAPFLGLSRYRFSFWFCPYCIKF